MSRSHISVRVDLPNGSSVSAETTLDLFYAEPTQKFQTFLQDLVETAMNAKEQDR